jgi:uncharacterized membrane protein YeiB
MAMSAEHSMPTRPRRYRSRVGVTLLFFGLIAGPFAWYAQLLVTYSLASHSCFPAAAPLASSESIHPAWIAILVVNLVAIALSLAAAVSSYANCRVARDGLAGGTAENVQRIEGRARFLASWGGAAALCFCGATIFDTIALLAVPSCLG